MRGRAQKFAFEHTIWALNYAFCSEGVQMQTIVQELPDVT